MGVYVYKVTAKIVTDDKGRPANLLEYAYKPYSGWNKATDRANAAMRRDAKVNNANQYVRRGKTFTGRITLEAGSGSIEWDRGTIEDSVFDNRLWDQKKEEEERPVLEEKTVGRFHLRLTHYKDRGRIVFSGGPHGPHDISDTSDYIRVREHWAGYCCNAQQVAITEAA